MDLVKVKSLRIRVARWALLLAALICLRTLVADTEAGKVQARAATNPALAVNLVSPRVGDWPRLITASGGLFAWQEGVIAAGTGGLRVTQVAVDVGDEVRLGQVLAILDQGQPDLAKPQ